MIGSTKLKATKTLVEGENSKPVVKTSIDKRCGRPVFRPLFRMTQVARTPLPGSSVAEQVTVNHLVAGSIPARAAMKPNNLSVVGLLPKKITVRLLSGPAIAQSAAFILQKSASEIRELEGETDRNKLPRYRLYGSWATESSAYPAPWLNRVFEEQS